MLKKLVIAAAAIVVGLGIIRFTKVGKEVSGLFELWCCKSGNWAKDQITPETRIEQLELKISKIPSEIDAAIVKKAELKTEYITLKQKIDRDEKALDQSREEVRALVGLLKQNSNEVAFKGEKVSGKSAREMFVQMDKLVQTADQTLKNNKEEAERLNNEMIQASLDIDKLKLRQAELVSKVGKLKSSLAAVRRKQKENNSPEIGSELVECETMLQELQKSILREDTLAEERARYGPTQPTTPTADDRAIEDRMKAYETPAGVNTKTNN
jgi:chromosome segregation ATPase